MGMAAAGGRGEEDKGKGWRADLCQSMLQSVSAGWSCGRYSHGIYTAMYGLVGATAIVSYTAMYGPVDCCVCTCRGSFYPGTGGVDEVGTGRGLGHTVNIPWEARDMSNGDYLSAFSHVLIPIAYEYNPDIIIVSAGFDAAEGDPIGECRVTPEGYAHMTSMLKSIAPVVLVLEGGYNLRSTARSTEACLRVLLGEQPGCLPGNRFPSPFGLQAIQVCMCATVHVSLVHVCVYVCVTSACDVVMYACVCHYMHQWHVCHWCMHALVTCINACMTHLYPPSLLPPPPPPFTHTHTPPLPHPPGRGPGAVPLLEVPAAAGDPGHAHHPPPGRPQHRRQQRRAPPTQLGVLQHRRPVPGERRRGMRERVPAERQPPPRPGPPSAPHAHARKQPQEADDAGDTPAGPARVLEAPPPPGILPAPHCRL